MARAGIEATSWKSVGQRGDEGLIGRFAAPKPVATDLFLIEVDLTSDESVGPEWIELQQMAKHFHCACIARAAQVNDASRGAGLPIELEAIGERSPRWQMVMTVRQTLRISASKALGKDIQGRQVFVMATRPDLLLPQPIKVFDHSLEAGLERRREDGRHAKGQAKTHDAPDDIRMVMAALEAHIVVELRESGHAVPPPVGLQGIKDKRSRSHLRRPGGNSRSPKCPCRKDLEQPEAFHPQVFDHIKAIYLGELLRGRRQIPARWWRGPANPVVTIEQTVAPENTPNRSHAGHRGEMRLAQEHLVNGLGTNEPQGALRRELPA